MGTGLLLGVLSIISVLLALAVWLWGTASNREQRQASLQHAEQQLATRRDRQVPGAGCCRWTACCNVRACRRVGSCPS